MKPLNYQTHHLAAIQNMYASQKVVPLWAYVLLVSSIELLQDVR